MADPVGIFCDNTTDVDDSGAGNCMFGVTAAVERMEYTSSCKTHGIHRMYIYTCSGSGSVSICLHSFILIYMYMYRFTYLYINALHML